MSSREREWHRRIGRRVKLRDLHILGAVARLGSMGRAAGELAMTQPAVSLAIADLEAAVGVRLLDRRSSGVRPTVYGEALLRRGAEAFHALSQGVRDIESLLDPEAGQVRVGCPETLAAGFLPSVM